jgi:hypothetical protein
MRLSVSVLALLALLSWSLPAAATDTRVQSMGGGSLYHSLVDEASMLLYPSTIPLFGDSAWLEGGTQWPGTDPNAATNGVVPYQAGGSTVIDLTGQDFVGFSGGSWARHVGATTLELAFKRWPELSAASLKLTDDDQAALFTGDTAINNAANWGSLFYARKQGPARFGAVVTIWNDTTEHSTAGKADRRLGGTLVDGRLGAGYDFGGDNSFDAALGVQIGTYKDDTLNPDGKLGTRLMADTSWGVNLDARGRFKAFKGNHLVPWFQMDFGGEGVAWNTTDADAPAYRASSFGAAAGLDLVIQPLERFFIIPGLGLEYEMLKIDGVGTAGASGVVDYSALALPSFGLGVEAPLSDWFVLRFGARRSVVFTSLEESGVKTTTLTSENTIKTGFGLRFKSVTMDFLLDPTFWSNGPYALSGKPMANDAFASFALKATW